MAVRKEDEIMAEYLLKGGKMLEKTCKTCGCPLFEVKGKTLCVVCAENAPAEKTAKNTGANASAVTAGAHHTHDHGSSCGCGMDHDEVSCDCDEDSCSCEGDEGGMLTDELAMTVFSLCERIQNEKDPENVLLLMNAVKAGTESLEILCKL
ncbi:MAG: Sjogren's syndrome/scleroderma autoantigen 1 family protein [Methanoregula sp.]|nr:Sjogren's syndrome/scleroderma autoantigen 1 family protein [Methanoregula sp.]